MKTTHTFVVLAYKESPYLEDCLKSVLNQTIKTNVLIATSTPNDYIKKMAQKYHLKVQVNKESKGIGYDFDFALSVGATDLVTIAHQDDIYDESYAEEIIKAYEYNPEAIIIFPNYYEIKNGAKETKNINLLIKRLLLFPLRFKVVSGWQGVKRFAIRFGSAIGCPSVTFVKKKCPKRVFASKLKCNVDWLAWERLSKRKGKFIYIPKYLMGHRIHEESTTTQIIQANIRTEEDFFMFQKFWPKSIARVLTRFYAHSEKNNNLDKREVTEKKLIIKGHDHNPLVKFWNWGFNIYYKNPQIWNYLIVGFLTLVVSLLSYYIFTRTFLNPNNNLELQIANVLSWVMAVIFAYFANRIFVFKSKNKNYGQEFLAFVGSRILTLLLDMATMYIIVSLLSWPDFTGKIISQVIVIIMNYIFSKLLVFKTK